MNNERTGKCLRQVEHIRGHLSQMFRNVNQAIIVYICCQTLMLDYNYRLVMIKGNITSYFSYYMTAVNRTTTYNDDSGYLLLVYVNILQPSYMILSTFKPV